MADKIALEVDVQQAKDQVYALAGSLSRETIRAVGSGSMGTLLRAVSERVGAENVQRAYAARGAQPPEFVNLGVTAARVRELRAAQRFDKDFTTAGRSPLQQALSGIQLGLGAAGAGGAAGLVGTVGQFAGILGKVNPALLVAAGALGGLASATASAARQLMEIGQARITTGGTSGQVALGRILASAVGMDPGGIAGVAHSLRQRFALDPMGQAAARSLGIGGLPTPRGLGAPVNEMDFLLRAIRGLRAAPSDTARQRIIEQAPELEPFAMLGNASKETMDRIEALAEQMNRIATPELLARTMEFRMSLGAFHQQWNALMMTIGGPVIRFLTQGMNEILSGLQQLGLIPTAAQTAQQRQAEALSANTRALQMVREGLFGGGPRAQHAIPPGLRGFAFDEAIRRQAVQLGAF